MKTYDKFISLIKEGLIRTHNIYNYSSSLINNLMFVGFDLNLKIENKFRYTIEIINHKLLLNYGF